MQYESNPQWIRALVCCRFAGTSFDHKHRSFVYQRTSGVPYHIEVGRFACLQLCRALCGLLCLTLWARPEHADEAPREQTLLHSQKLPSCTAAAVVVGFAPLSYYCYCCSCGFSADGRESTSIVHGQVMCRHRVVVASLLRLIVATLGRYLGAPDRCERRVPRGACIASALGRSSFFFNTVYTACLLYTSPSPRDLSTSRMPSSA